MTLKAYVEGLTKEMMEGAVHIYTKRALVPIPEGVEQHVVNLWAVPRTANSTTSVLQDLQLGQYQGPCV